MHTTSLLAHKTQSISAEELVKQLSYDENQAIHLLARTKVTDLISYTDGTNNQTILHIAAKLNAVNFFIKYEEKLHREKPHSISSALTPKDPMYNGVIHTAILSNTKDFLRIYLETLKKNWEQAVIYEINFLNILGYAPLHLAVIHDRIECVEILSEYGAHFDLEVKYSRVHQDSMMKKGYDVLDDVVGHNSLHLAAIHGHYDVLSALIEGINDQTQLMKTVGQSSILASEINPNFTKNIIHLMIESKKNSSENFPIIDKIISKLSSQNRKILLHNPDVAFNNLFLFAAKENKFEIAERLHETFPEENLASSVNLKDHSNIVSIALQNNRQDIAMRYMDSVKIGMIIDSQGNTLIHIAVRFLALDNFKIFFDRVNAWDLNQVNSRNETPLHIALKLGNQEFANLIINKMKNDSFDMLDLDNNHIFLMCIKLGYHNLVQNIIDKDPTVPDRLNPDSDGNNSLHMAINNNDLDMVKILIKNSFENLSLPNQEQITPLGIAVKKNYLKILEFLKPSLMILIAKDQITLPLKMAYDNNNKEIFAFLVQLSTHASLIKIENLSLSKNNILMELILEGNPKKEFIVCLIEKFPDLIVKPNRENNTILHVTTNSDIIKTLVKYLNQRQIKNVLSLANRKGNTPMQIALKSDYQLFINLFFDCMQPLDIIDYRFNNKNLLVLSIENGYFYLFEKIVTHPKIFDLWEITAKTENSPLYQITEFDNRYAERLIEIITTKVSLEKFKLILSIECDEYNIYKKNYIARFHQKYQDEKKEAAKGIVTNLEQLIKNLGFAQKIQKDVPVEVVVGEQLSGNNEQAKLLASVHQAAGVSTSSTFFSVHSASDNQTNAAAEKAQTRLNPLSM